MRKRGLTCIFKDLLEAFALYVVYHMCGRRPHVQHVRENGLHRKENLLINWIEQIAALYHLNSLKLVSDSKQSKSFVMSHHDSDAPDVNLCVPWLVHQ